MDDGLHTDAQLRITLFGGPLLVRAGEPIPLSPSQGAFLSVLVAHGRRGVGRTQLHSLLWKKGTDAQLRPRLNQLVYETNQRLGGVRAIRLTDGAYTLESGRLESDLEAFLIALRDHDLLPAVEIATRGFLSGMVGPPTSEMEQWVQERDRRFRSDVRTLASARWSEAEQRGDWGMAEEAAQVLLRLGPDDESALRRLIQAKALMGRVREAQAVYAGYCDLARVMEPGWEPEADTEGILSRLEEFAARGRQVVALRSSSARDDPPFVGRREELASLSAIFRRPPADHFHMVVVSGEGGIGKTRLVREALSRAPFDGIRVLEGGCSEFEKNIPLSPLIRAISQEWIAREIERLPTPWRELLQAHLPEFAADAPDVSVLLAGAAEEVPRVTCEAFLRLFRQVAEGEPLLLFLDDLQWIDATSFSVLQYVRDRWAGPGLLFVATVRVDEVDRDTPLHRWLSIGTDRVAPALTRLELGPLGTEDVRALMECVLQASAAEGSEVGVASRVSSFAELMGGHPLLALEYARHLANPTDGSDPGVDGLRVPEAVRETVHRRTARLAAEARTILEGLSPSGKPLPASLLERVSGVLGADFARALDEAVDQRLLSVSPRGVEFRHGLIREAIYQELSEARRLAMHRAIGEALAAESDSALDLDVALHLLAAGEGRRAVPYVLRASQAAIDSGGWSEARMLLEAALGAELTALERGELHGLLGGVLVLTGEFRRAVESWGRAEQSFLRARKIERALACRLRQAHAALLDPESDRLAVLAQVRHLVEESSDLRYQALAAECMGLEVAVLDRLERLDEVRSVAAQALALVPTVHGEEKLQFLLVAMVDAVYGNPQRAAVLADQALELATTVGRPDLGLRALNWKLIALYHLAKLNLDEGRALIDRALRASRRAGDLEQRFWLHANLGAWQLDTGEYDSAARSFHQADRVLSGLSAPHLRRVLLTNQGQLELEAGDASLARDLFRQSLHEGTVSSWGPHRCSALAGLALTHVHRGEVSEAKFYQAALPARPQLFTFDPTLWITLDARLALMGGTDPGLVVRSLFADAASLRGSVRTAWMRLQLLGVEIGSRRGVPLEAHGIAELETFLRDHRIGVRLDELRRHLRR